MGFGRRKLNPVTKTMMGGVVRGSMVELAEFDACGLPSYKLVPIETVMPGDVVPDPVCHCFSTVRGVVESTTCTTFRVLALRAHSAQGILWNHEFVGLEHCTGAERLLGHQQLYALVLRGGSCATVDGIVTTMYTLPYDARHFLPRQGVTEYPERGSNPRPFG